MVEIRVRYEGGLRCQATHAPSGTTLATDAPVDNQGRGESFSPTDLVATALGTCILTTMGIVARRHGIEMKDASVRVEKHMENMPRRIARLPVELSVPGVFTPEQKQLLENAAHGCPVHKSLHPDIDARITFRWHG